MVRLILGTAQSGKTTAAIDRIRETLKKGKSDVWMLVPEQASFDTEKELIRTLGVAVAGRVQVVSFTRLCHTILRDTGGLATPIADEGTRLLLMGQALENVKNDLVRYGAVAKDPSFAAKILKDINEIKQSALTAENLRAAAEEVPSALAAKLRDVAAVLDAYDHEIHKTFIDPQDVCGFAARRAGEEKWFQNKVLIADGFTGFTAAQYQLLDPALRDAEECVFLFTCDGETPSNGVDLFSGIRNEIATLRAMAKRRGITVTAEPTLLTSYAKGEGLAAAEQVLRGKNVPVTAASALQLISCETAEDEASFAASTIRRLVRETGARWRDFVIFTGKDAHYEQTVAAAMAREGIPCFLSQNTVLATLPLARYLSAILGAAVQLSTESVLRSLKSGLSALDDAQVDALENYAYLWSLSGNDWKQPWTLPTTGLEETAENPEDSEQELAELNAWREKAVAPILSLQRQTAHPARVCDLVKAIFSFLSGQEVDKRLEVYAAWLNETDHFEQAALQSGSWNAVMDVFDRFTRCIGDKTVTLKEFSGLLEAAFAAETLGEIPARADEVVFGTADRLRPMHPKTVFILGAGEGVFPAAISSSGLFTTSDRVAMKDAGAVLPDRSLSAAVEQQYLFYTAVCSASDAVYLTYRGSTAETKRYPSLPARALRDAFRLPEIQYSARTASPQILESAASAFRYLARHYTDPTAETETVAHALCEDAVYHEKLALLGKLRPDFDAMSEKTAESLYTKPSKEEPEKREMRISPSRAETYFKCPFSYFVNYGLSAKMRRRATLEGNIRGTVAHDVLENILRQYRGAYETLTRDILPEKIEQAVSAYFKRLGISPSDMPLASQLTLNRLKTGLVDVLCFLAEDFSRNGFKPEKFEFSFGQPGSEMAALKIPLDERHTVKINGAVDRVDVWRDGTTAYIRIADYKTYHKNLSLADTLCGQNLQMLLYLCAIAENGAEVFRDENGAVEHLVPAAVMYVPADPGADTSEDDSREETEEKPTGEFKLAVKGLFTDNADALAQMGVTTEKSRYVPVKFKNDGTAAMSESVITQETFDRIFTFTKQKIQQMGQGVLAGTIAVHPVNTSKDACQYCEFRPICRREVTEENDVTPYKGFRKKASLEELEKEIEQNAGT